MKKFVLFTLLLACFPVLFASAQCAEAGAAPEPVAPTTEVCANDFVITDLQIESYSTNPGVFTTNKIVVSRHTGTTPDSSMIVGVSEDGQFAFPTSGEPYGDYQFRVFAFNQADLNALAVSINPILGALGYPVIPIDGSGNVNLADVFTSVSTIPGYEELTVEQVEYVICVFLPSLPGNPTLNFALSSPYTVHWKETCQVGVNTPATTSLPLQVTATATTAYINVDNFRQGTPLTMNVYDLTGRLVTRTTFSTATYELSIADWAAGHYFVQVQNGSTTTTGRFVK